LVGKDPVMATQIIQGFSERLDIEEYRFLVAL